MKELAVARVSELQGGSLILGVTEHASNVEGWNEFVEAYVPALNDWVKSGDVSTKEGKVTTLPVADAPFDRLVCVGLGRRDELTTRQVREAFATVGKLARANEWRDVSFVASTFAKEKETKDLLHLATEGFTLGMYEVPSYEMMKNAPDYEWETWTAVTAIDEKKAVKAMALGYEYGEAVNYARTLINRPPNLLTARALADEAKGIAEAYGLEIDILKKKQLEEMGAGGLLAVNKGSVEPPRMIVLKYNGNPDSDEVLGLVGKGITYDTGGYSLKPKNGMVGMKGDMGGAAAVLGAMRIIATEQPKKNVVAVIASTDNMISGEAIRPDDIITSLSGKTIEVLNTDAEGRLVLADAVTYAQQEGATSIIDIATLTGGVIVALGKDKTGALTNDEAYFEAFLEAAVETDEFVWQLPLTENDKKRIRKSDVADLNNSPGGDGHMIFAGGFVGEFVNEGTPWIHLDIAGTSDTDAPHALGPKGGTGVMVRTLATFACK